MKKIFPKILKNPEVSRLLPDREEGGLSEQTYLVKDNGKKYVLRKYVSLKEVKEDEHFSKKLEKMNVIPHLLGRDGKNLLFEYIHGRDLHWKESLGIFRQMGEIIAKTHKIKVKQFNLDKNFIKELSFLREKKAIDKEFYEKIKNTYYLLKLEANPQVALDITDFLPDNFRIDLHGTIY
jgi:hypothetical protein